MKILIPRALGLPLQLSTPSIDVSNTISIGFKGFKLTRFSNFSVVALFWNQLLKFYSDFYQSNMHRNPLERGSPAPPGRQSPRNKTRQPSITNYATYERQDAPFQNPNKADKGKAPAGKAPAGKAPAPARSSQPRKASRVASSLQNEVTVESIEESSQK
jgi:hypothetical protein